MATSISDPSLKSLCAFLPVGQRVVFARVLDELIDLMDKDRHIEAENRFDILAKLLDESTASCRAGSGPASGEAKAPSVLSVQIVRDYLKASSEYALCMRKVTGCRNLVNFVMDPEGWTVGSVDENGHGTFSRAEKEVGSYSFKIVGLVDVPILSLASVLIEISLFKTWFPMCCASEEAGSPHRLHKFGRFLIKAPWPVAYRDVFVEGYAVDDLTYNRRVVIVGESVKKADQCPPGVRFLPTEGNHVRATIYRQGFVLEPRGDQTLISFVTNVDPHIKNIPMMLVNYISGKIVWVLLSQMSKAAKKSMDPTSEHAQLIKSSPHIYEYMAYRLRSVLDQWSVIDAETAQRTQVQLAAEDAWSGILRSMKRA